MARTVRYGVIEQIKTLFETDGWFRSVVAEEDDYVDTEDNAEMPALVIRDGGHDQPTRITDCEQYVLEIGLDVVVCEVAGLTLRQALDEAYHRCALVMKTRRDLGAEADVPGPAQHVEEGEMSEAELGTFGEGQPFAARTFEYLVWIQTNANDPALTG